MLILLPPSEGKSEAEGTRYFTDACPACVQHTQGVIDYLKGLSPAGHAKCYGVKDAAKAQAWHDANVTVLETAGLPAIERYTGVVYQHIGYATLSKKAAACKRLHIASAMFGLIPADAPIPPYKLPINPWLTRYWKPINSARLAREAKDKPVLNLLSQAYAKTIDYEPLISPDFKAGGGKKSAGHFGKAIKGRFVRWLLEERVTTTGRFSEFNEEGYRWDGRDFIRP